MDPSKLERQNGFLPLRRKGQGRNMGGPCLMNIGDTPDIGGGVISALSFRHLDFNQAKKLASLKKKVIRMVDNFIRYSNGGLNGEC